MVQAFWVNGELKQELRELTAAADPAEANNTCLKNATGQRKLNKAAAD
jgi:hypothetical protein